MFEKIIILKLELHSRNYKLNISQALNVSFSYNKFTMCRFLAANVPNYVITEEKHCKSIL